MSKKPVSRITTILQFFFQELDSDQDPVSVYHPSESYIYSKDTAFKYDVVFKENDNTFNVATGTISEPRCLVIRNRGGNAASLATQDHTLISDIPVKGAVVLYPDPAEFKDMYISGKDTKLTVVIFPKGS